MKEQIISERANIIANLRQLVQSLVELNTKMVTKVGRLPKRLRNHTSVQTPFLTVCILK